MLIKWTKGYLLEEKGSLSNCILLVFLYILFFFFFLFLTREMNPFLFLFIVLIFPLELCVLSLLLSWQTPSPYLIKKIFFPLETDFPPSYLKNILLLWIWMTILFSFFSSPQPLSTFLYSQGENSDQFKKHPPFTERHCFQIHSWELETHSRENRVW